MRSNVGTEVKISRLYVPSTYVPRFINVVKERPPVQLQEKKEKKDLALNDLRANLFSFFSDFPRESH